MGREINSVGVVGGGLMGAGIAEVSAVAGLPVVVRDLPQFLEAARARVETSLAGATTPRGIRGGCAQRGHLPRSRVSAEPGVPRGSREGISQPDPDVDGAGDNPRS